MPTVMPNTAIALLLFSLHVGCFKTSVSGFTPTLLHLQDPRASTTRRVGALANMKPVEGAKKFLESLQEGRGVKQSMADAVAGDITGREKAILKESLDLAQSAPCVLFTWSFSPSCKKAVKALELMDASVKVKELDRPWREGNAIRSVLGRHVGRSSVPIIFIGGKYIGGYNEFAAKIETK